MIRFDKMILPYIAFETQYRSKVFVRFFFSPEGFSSSSISYNKKKTKIDIK